MLFCGFLVLCLFGVLVVILGCFSAHRLSFWCGVPGVFPPPTGEVFAYVGVRFVELLSALL